MKTVNKIQCFNPIAVMAIPIKVFVGSLRLKIMLGLTMERSNQMLLVSILGISTLLSNYSYASSEELTQWLVVDEFSTMESQILELTPVINESLTKASAIDAELAQLQINLATTEEQLQESLLTSETTSDSIALLTSNITVSSTDLNAAVVKVSATEDAITEAQVSLVSLQSDVALLAEDDPSLIELNAQIDLLENTINTDLALALSQAEADQLRVEILLSDQNLELLSVQQQLIVDQSLTQLLTSQYQTLQDSESIVTQELNVINQLVAQFQLEEVGIKQTYATELGLVSQQVAQLSDSQIKSLTQTLERTNRKGITLDLNSAELQTLLDGGYSFQQTNMFVKAYVEEAKFLSKADELRTEAEATGNAELLEQADKMEARAAQKKSNFTDKAAGRKPKPKSSQQSDELRAEAATTGNAELLQQADKMDAKAAKKEAKAAKEAGNRNSASNGNTGGGKKGNAGGGSASNGNTGGGKKGNAGGGGKKKK
jgi:hypothetical protein